MHCLVWLSGLACIGVLLIDRRKIKFNRKTLSNFSFFIKFASSMKKLLTAFTLVCYLAVTCGFVISQHYCMNKHTASQLFISTKDVCDNCGMHKQNAKGCCRDEVVIVKLVQDQNNNQVSAIEFSLPDNLIFTPSAFMTANFENGTPAYSFQKYLPPDLSDQDAYLQHNVFLI